MKKLTHGQLRLIAALNFVIICLLAGVIWILPFSAKTTGASGGAEEYKRERAGQISLNPNLSWQLSLLGSGTEEAVFTYTQGDLLYIFGNTTSYDKDFDRAGIFLIIIDAYGKTRADGFFMYGAEGDVLKKAIPAEGGFLLAVEGVSLPYLILIDPLGGEIKKVLGFVNMFEDIAEIRHYSDGFILLTQPRHSVTGVKRLRCVFFNQQLNFTGSVLAESPYSLLPVETVIFSHKTIVFCNAQSDISTFPCAVEFVKSSSAGIKIFSEYAGRVAGFSINKGDYLLLTEYEGCSILKINNALEAVQTYKLSLLKPLLLTDLDDNFYAVFLQGSAYILNSDLLKITTLDGFAPSSHAYINSLALFCGNDSAGLVRVLVFLGGAVKLNAYIGTGQSPILCLSDTRIFCISHSEGDIVISALRYPIF